MATRAQRTSRFAITVACLTLVWCVWNESVALHRVLEGIGLGTLGLLLTNRFLLKEVYQDRYAVGFTRVLKYIGVVIVQIFVSGIDAIWITVTNRLNVGIIDLPTDISDPFRRVLVANAITLTPGTVTLECGEKTMKVVWINCVTGDPEEAAEMIKGSFERVLGEQDGEHDIEQGERS